ncbi:MAG: site-2 protease family protein [Thaumarchaeota archaeon]|nr:site-2 protease family protein [Nitrososphaerota archaeon]
MEKAPEDMSLTFEDVDSLVRSRFTVSSVMLRDSDMVEYTIEKAPAVKKNFETLILSLKQKGGAAILRPSEYGLNLIVRKHMVYPASTSRIPILLLFATLGTITVDGVLRFLAFEGSITPFIVLLYTVGLFGIIGTHELGHKVASAMHRTRSSMPYFIPGIPTIWPTFGALIKATEPPVNKDSLFDLGISGPLAGLAVAILVAIGGALTTVSLTAEEIAKKTAAGALKEIPHIDIFSNFILGIFAKQTDGSILVLSPLTFAASLGFLVTFLNLMPAWQLDGGHVARAVLNEREHRYFTYASAVVMFVLGFWLMALLVIFMSARSPEMKPLDDVSELSKSRRVFFVIVLILTAALYYFTILDNPYFTMSQL